MDDISYIVNIENFDICQKYFFNKGYFWVTSNGKNTEIFNPFKDNASNYDYIIARENEVFIIHVPQKDINHKRLGWDNIDIINNGIEYNFKIFKDNRVNKLNRILNG